MSSSTTLLGDFHIHTVASAHAYSTVTEIANHAASLGLAYIGIADHGPDMLDGPHPYYFANLKVVPSRLAGVRLYKGIELNIMDRDGRTDYAESYAKHLDYAIASFHDHVSAMDLGADDYTNAVAVVAKNSYVKVIGHPGNPKFPVHVTEFVEICRLNEVAIELNNSSFIYTRKGSYPQCLAIAKEAARQKADVLLSSDAHYHLDVGRLDKVYDLLAEADLSPDQIINYSHKKIQHYFGAEHDE